MIGEYLEFIAENAGNYPALFVLLLLAGIAFPYLVLADLTRREYRLPMRSGDQ